MQGVAIVALMFIVLIETVIILNQQIYITELHETRRDLEALLYDKVTMRE